jgi:creatinine amidohydrolase/Fe(II)-dependent formamide hydrolase-like protein
MTDFQTIKKLTAHLKSIGSTAIVVSDHGGANFVIEDVYRDGRAGKNGTLYIVVRPEGMTERDRRLEV